MKDMLEFTVKNLNREKLLRQIVVLCSVSDIKFDEQNIKFKVQTKHKKTVEKIIQKNGMQVLSQKRVGCFAFLKNSVLRWGVAIPLVVCFVLAYVANLFVFKYQIIGNQLVSTEQILQVLTDNNVSGFVLKNKIDTSELEIAVQQIDKISLVSAIILGNTLVVNIKEKVYNAEYEQQGEFEYICSNYDGIITEISPVSGTVLVKVGQTVKKGQQLVAPYVTDTSGQIMSVKPMADIKADVFFTYTEQVPDTKIQMVDTGNVIKKTQVSLLGLPVYSSQGDCDFATYRIEQITQDLTAGLILPLKITTIMFYEQIEQVLENYFLTNKQQILDECKQKTRQLVKDYEIIKNEYQTVTSEAGLTRVTSTVVVNKSIC